MGNKKRIWFFKRPKLSLPKFSRPKFNLKLVLIFTLILLVVGGGTVVYLNYEPVPPQEAVSKAINDTLNAESYRYQAISKKIVNGQEKLLSEVTGEKSNGNVHFTGKLHIVNSDFEIYQISDKLYRKDVFSEDWLVVENQNVEATEKLIQEVNPLGAFAFNGPIDVEYIGKEKIGDKKCKKYEVMAQTENKYLVALWKDFVYTIWVDKSGKLAKAQISAVNKQDENNQLVMSVQFSDFNQEIVINPPI